MSHLITIDILKSASWYDEFRRWLRIEMLHRWSDDIKECIKEGCVAASFMTGRKGNEIRIVDSGIFIAEKDFFPFRNSFTKVGFLGTILAALRASHIESEKHWVGMEERYYGSQEYEELYKPLIAAIQGLNKSGFDELFAILFPGGKIFEIVRESIAFVNEQAKELESKLREAQNTILELKVELSEKEKMLAQRKIAAETEENEEPLNTKFTATPLQTILLFRELGMDFTNGSEFNKTKVKKMLNILTTKSEGNINKKLTAIDDNNKYVKNDLKIVRDLLKDIKN